MQRTTSERCRLVRRCFTLGWLLAAPACGTTDIDAPADNAVFVRIIDNAFAPETVTVGSGISVRWTNDGAVLHSVVSDSGVYQSQLLSPTWWFEVRFDSLGTFPYHCSRHPEMTGAVIVQ